jgi:uncharacterized protein YfdQ (DUF2303 family)
MKNNEKLTIVELIDWIKDTGREMRSMDISNRNLPNAINRSKAVALLTKAALQAADHARKNGTSLETTKLTNQLETQTKKGKVKLIS